MGRSVCHDFLIGREVKLTCANRSTCSSIIFRVTRESRESRNNKEEERNRRNAKERDNNRRNDRKQTGGGERRSTKPRNGKPKARRISGEDFYTFSLDGLIPSYGDPSQVGIIIIVSIQSIIKKKALQVVK